MGNLMAFYAGDADGIEADREHLEFAPLSKSAAVRAYVDFSLHLTPIDIDFLFEAIADRLGKPHLSLLDSLIRTLGETDDTAGADVVAPTWVQTVAAADPATAPDLAAEWMKRVGAEYGEQIELSSEAVQAVAELIHLCQLAVAEGVDVVFAWSL